MSPVEALTDLTFNGVDIDFNFGLLTMPVSKGGTFTMNLGTIKETELQTNSGTFIMNGGQIRESTQSVVDDFYENTLKRLKAYNY